MKRAPMRTGPRPPHRRDRDRDRGGTRAVARHPLEIPTSESKQDSNGSRIPYEYSLKTLLPQSYPQACKPTRFILKERDRDRDRDRGRDRTRRASRRTGPRLRRWWHRDRDRDRDRDRGRDKRKRAPIEDRATTAPTEGQNTHHQQ